VHPLAAKARGRVERRNLAPRPTRQTCLLFELTPRASQWCLTLLERSGRQLHELGAHRFATLSNESQHPLAIDGDDRDGAGVTDDLALVLAPPFERDVDQLAVVSGSR
jgi:hypothetical protein